MATSSSGRLTLSFIPGCYRGATSSSSGRSGSAVVGQLHREVVDGALDQGDDRLEVVALLRGDPDLLALDLDLDALGALVADQLADLLGLLLRDALLEGDADLGLLAGLPRLAGVQDLQALVALDQLLLEDVEDGL